MTASQQPKEYTFACECCQNKCKVTSLNAIPPDCGCIINSDIGALWKIRPAPASTTAQQRIERAVHKIQCQSEIARNCGLRERYEGMQEAIALLQQSQHQAGEQR